MARKIDSKTQNGISVFLERVRSEHDVTAAYLYGSRARGDHNEESDADLALIMRDPAKATSRFAVSLGALEFDVLMETGVFVSAMPIAEADWKHPSSFSNSELIANIKRDGIAL